MEIWDLSPEEIQEKLDSMVWSFSRISATTCLYSWYKQYIAECEEEPNAFAQFGTVCHETLEKYLKGELDLFELPKYYKKRFKKVVTCSFPPNKYADLRAKAFFTGESYFENINFL